MTGTPVLTTERLELWRPAAQDFRQLHAMMQSEETRRFLGSWEPSEADIFARLLRNAGSWELYGYGTFMVRAKGDPQIIGNCGIFHSWRGLGEDFDNMPEAGWIMAEGQVGKGIAGEAMRAAYAWFDRVHGPCRSVCMIEPGNAPSIRMAEKLGFTRMREAELGGAPLVLFERIKDR